MCSTVHGLLGNEGSSSPEKMEKQDPSPEMYIDYWPQLSKRTSCSTLHVQNHPKIPTCESTMTLPSAMDVQFTIHGLWICELSPPVASAPPRKPTWASWNRFRQQFGCKIHWCPSQKLGLLWDPWPLFSVAHRNSKAHLFKENTNLQKLRKLRKKKWEVNLASLCFVAAGLVEYAPGN